MRVTGDISFAIPSEYVQKFLKELMNSSSRVCKYNNIYHWKYRVIYLIGTPYFCVVRHYIFQPSHYLMSTYVA